MKIATVPAEPPLPSFPNGLAFNGAGDLFVSASFTAKIYRIAPRGHLTVWSDSPLLAGTTGNGPCGRPHPFGAIGVNGLAFDAHGDLLAANTSQGTVVHVAVNPDGSAGGTDVYAGPDCRLWGADGLAVDVAGNVYVAANAEEDLVRIDARRDRSLHVLAAQAVGDPLSTPTGVAFGTAFRTRHDLFVTNFAFFHNGDGSGVVSADVGVPGLPLP